MRLTSPQLRVLDRLRFYTKKNGISTPLWNSRYFQNENIGKILVKKGLLACRIINKVESYYITENGLKELRDRHVAMQYMY